jgi:hypothetical protein
VSGVGGFLVRFNSARRFFRLKRASRSRLGTLVGTRRFGFLFLSFSFSRRRLKAMDLFLC